MAAVQIQSMSQLHEDLLRTIIANPTLTLRDLSAMYGYSQSWLCIVMNSDVFQARLREANNGMLAAVTQSIGEQLEVIARVGLPKIAQHVEKSEDPEFVRDTVDTVLKRLGYGVARGGAAGPVNVQQNNYYVSKEDLHECRGNIYSAGNEQSNDSQKSLTLAPPAKDASEGN